MSTRPVTGGGGGGDREPGPAWSDAPATSSGGRGRRRTRSSILILPALEELLEELLVAARAALHDGRCPEPWPPTTPSVRASHAGQALRDGAVARPAARGPSRLGARRAGRPSARSRAATRTQRHRAGRSSSVATAVTVRVSGGRAQTALAPSPATHAWRSFGDGGRSSCRSSTPRGPAVGSPRPSMISAGARRRTADGSACGAGGRPADGLWSIPVPRWTSISALAEERLQPRGQLVAPGRSGAREPMLRRRDREVARDGVPPRLPRQDGHQERFTPA